MSSSIQASTAKSPSPTGLYAKLLDNHIRILQLLPAADPSDGIECRLNEYALNRAPSYKALSYAWKEDDRSVRSADEDLPRREGRVSVEIRRRGIYTQHTVTVSRSLFLALRRLRHATRPSHLWVDNLCIDQCNSDDRTSQVELMGSIYQSASEVIIWLGERETEDELGEWLQGIYQRTIIHHDWSDDISAEDLVDHYINSYEQLNTSSTGSITQRQDIYGAFCLIWLLSRGQRSSNIPFYHASSFTQGFTNRFRMEWATQVSEGLRAIMGRTWWRRAWVVQETVLARKATIVYSTLSAPWLMFARAARNYLQEHLKQDVDQRRLVQDLTSTYTHQEHLRTSDALGDFANTVLSIENTRTEWASQEDIRLLPLLRRYRVRQATDGRDKVFSLLGLVNKWTTPPLKANYGMTKDELYVRTTTHIIEDTQSLAVLNGTVSLSSHSWNLTLPDHNDYKLSWVTDWSTPMTDGGLEMERLGRLEHYAAGPPRGHAYLHDDYVQPVLEIKGYFVGKISSVADSTPRNAIEQLRQTILSWESWWLSTNFLSEATSIIHIFAQTVCGKLLYKPDSTANSASELGLYTRADPPEIQYTYRAWISDTTAKRNRRTAMLDKLITNSYKEPENITQAKNSFYYSVRVATVNRRLFAFQVAVGKGYAELSPSNIGVGPPNVKAGDLIFVPLGSKVPLIIRRGSSFGNSFGEPGLYHRKQKLIGTLKGGNCGERHALHQLIGDAYVNDFMDGEVLPRRPGERTRDTVYLG